MKLILILLFPLLFIVNPAKACSEMGPREFEVSQEAQKKCQADARIYATQFGKTYLNTEAKIKGSVLPKKVLMYESAVIYKTKKQVGNSNLVGFNVAMKSKDGWECNFCVDMTIDEKEVCHIDSVTKNMCSK